MTVDEFYEWEPPAGLGHFRWELVDGEPVCMAPPSVTHGIIQGHAAFLLVQHLRSHRPLCRLVVTPGVIPHLRSKVNHRVPDLGVACGPINDNRSLHNPVLLVEILSPSNEDVTRANAWAYATIPSVREVLILSSNAIRAELLRQGDEIPIIVEGHETLRLNSIGFEAPLSEFYATTNLR